MFQSIITSQYKNQFNSDDKLHTGWYQFHYRGGLITGNIVRIGETVVVKTLTIGTIEINTLKFIDSNPVKL